MVSTPPYFGAWAGAGNVRPTTRDAASRSASAMARMATSASESLGTCGLCESASLQHPRIGVHAEPRPLRHDDATVDGVDGIAERVPREVAVEALDQRLTGHRGDTVDRGEQAGTERSEEHTSELQSHLNLVCRL